MAIRNIDEEMRQEPKNLQEDDAIRKAMDEQDEGLDLTSQEEAEAIKGDPTEPSVKGLSGRELYELQTHSHLWKRYVEWLEFEAKMIQTADLDNDDPLVTAKAKGKVLGLRTAMRFPQEAIQLLRDKQREGEM